MKDNEIIKALECCCKPVGQACKECPLNSKGVDCLDFDIDKLILDLINRQKAEIERLQTENRILSQKRMNLFERLDFIEKAKVEAVKEFAERLKEEFMANTDNNGDINSCLAPIIIDNLVKEMVGEG